jgi:GTP-binding protein EngB required for normal cell division
MKYIGLYIKKQLTNIAQIIMAVLVWLPGTLVISSCEGIRRGDFGYLPTDKVSEKEGIKKKEGNNTNLDEIIVFCGNPGVGKSSLCNSIFQEPVFQSGVSFGRGMTELGQRHIYQNKMYIDTPGLSDIKLREQAAQEIEKSLKHNSNYKIVFVATLESGRIRPDDLVTINAVCDAIKTKFEYGLIFNKVSKALEEQINKMGIDRAILDNFLDLVGLHKKPSKIIILQKDADMEDCDNKYFQTNDKNRTRLLNFLDGLRANRVEESAVDKIDVRDFQAKIEEMEKNHKAAMEELNKALKEQEEKMKREKAEFEAQMRRLKVEQEEKEKKFRAEQEEREKKFQAEIEKNQSKSKAEIEEEKKRFRAEQEEKEKKFRAEQEEKEKQEKAKREKEMEEIRAQEARTKKIILTLQAQLEAERNKPKEVIVREVIVEKERGCNVM